MSEREQWRETVAIYAAWIQRTLETETMSEYERAALEVAARWLLWASEAGE